LWKKSDHRNKYHGGRGSDKNVIGDTREVDLS